METTHSRFNTKKQPENQNSSFNLPLSWSPPWRKTFKIFLSHEKGLLYVSTTLGAFCQTKQVGIYNWDTRLNTRSTPPHWLLIRVKWNISSHSSCSDEAVCFSKQRKEVSGEFSVRGTFCLSGAQNQKAVYNAREQAHSNDW